MKLTIIPLDKSIYKDNICYYFPVLDGIPSNVHALQWENNAGWIEFNDGSVNQEIQSLPEWANNCVEKWNQAEFNEKNPPAPTPEELLASCKLKAKALLANSDWSVLPDVGLKNTADYVTYRGILRGLVIQPQETPDFPVEPTPVWN